MLVERIVEAPLQVIIYWQDEKIVRVQIGWSAPVGDHSQVSKDLTRELAHLFCRYLQGTEVKWPPLPLAWERLPDFSQQVLKTLAMQVPYGEWVSYGQLAALVAAPNAARAVGQVLGANPFPLFVPCHRVLRADQELGGYSAGLKLKRFLLQLEGINGFKRA